MEFDYSNENEIAILELSGRIHLYEIHHLREKFDEMKELTFKKIIIDLSKVDHIDSSGLGLLIAQASRYKDRGVPFIITGINSSIEYLFKLTSFSKLFIKLPNIQEAKKYS